MGALAATVLLASVILDASAFNSGGILAWIPECPSRSAGGSCALCGLTHSFIAISHGDLSAAAVAHPSGVWIYIAFVLAALGGIAAAAGLLRGPRKFREESKPG